MPKYDRMVEMNRLINTEKIERAKEAIRAMLSEDLRVTVAGLVKETGLSRAFFYNNEDVFRELTSAREIQKGRVFATPKQEIFNRAMSKQLRILEKEVSRLRRENDALTLENESLRIRADENELSLVESL